MKKVLILVLSTDKQWYGQLAATSAATWDSVDVPGVETIFYFAATPGKATDSKHFYAECDDDYWNMGRKTLEAFNYALAHRTFDFIFRANASLYCDKPGLLKYAQDKPTENLALGVVADCGSAKGERFSFLWGPGFMLSRDVVERVVANQAYWDHTLTDDNSISRLLTSLQIPLDNRGSMASVAINKGWYDFVYYENGASGGATLYSLKELRERLPGQFAFRVKCDSDRAVDVQLMKELHEVFTT